MFSQPVLLALVEPGLTRDDAYRIVQRNAMRTWRSARPFRDVLARRPRRHRVLGDDALDECFDLDRGRCATSARVFDALDALEPLAVRPVSEPSRCRTTTRGKVRELYEVDHDRMLVVASDRISVFDVVLRRPDPRQGPGAHRRCRTFWFEQTAHLVAATTSCRPTPPTSPRPPGPDVAGRAMLVRRREPDADSSASSRGYLFGSAWKEYQETGTVHGRPAAAGLAPGRALPEPIFTPTTKARAGHDELRSTDAEAAASVGDDRSSRRDARRCAIYELRRRARRAHGLILADTKLEFGELDGRAAA